MEFHELSYLFPDMSGDEFNELKRSISEIGLLEPIDLFEGKIIDGRHRYQACIAVDVEPKYKQFVGDFSEALNYVLAKNKDRRHLTESQKAGIAVKSEELLERFEKQAHENSLRNLEKNNITDSQKIVSPKTLHKEWNKNSVSGKLASIFNTNRTYIDQAKKVRKKQPDLLDKVIAGEIKLPVAYDIIRKEEKQQERKEQIKTIEILHNYVNGDCLIEIPNLLQPKSVRLLLTDPPYGMNFQSNSRTESEKAPKIENDSDIDTALKLFDDMLKVSEPYMLDDCHLLAFCNWRYEHNFMEIIEQNDYKICNSLVWVKENHTSGDLSVFAPKHERIIYAKRGNIAISPRIPDVLEYKRENNTSHPTEKPVELLKRLIEVTTIKNEFILDPFSGTGSTIKACKALNRNGIGIELNQEWYEEGLVWLA